jgi:hypothetical protein
MQLRQADDLVEIGRFADRLQAELALSVIRGSGMEGHIDQPFTSSLHHLLTPLGIRLFVRASDAARAKMLLQPADDSSVP